MTETPNSEPRIHLREFFSALLEQLELRQAQRFDAQQKALDKAEAAAEKRFESVNEFRNQLKDQQALFATRAEMIARFQTLEEKIGAAAAILNKSEGRGSGRDYVAGYFIGLAGLIVAALSIFWKAAP